MINNCNPTLGRFDLTEADKVVIKKLGDPNHDLGRSIKNYTSKIITNLEVGGNLCKEMAGLIGGRLANAQEENKQAIEKFKKIEKDHPFDLASSGTGNDPELDSAFKVIEDAIRKLKEGEKDPRIECRKLQVKNKVGSLMGMFYNN